MWYEAVHMRRRRGFGMMEIIILLAVLSVVGMLVIKVVSQANRLQNVQETWTILERTRLAMYNVADNPVGTSPIAFNQEVGVNLGKISELNIPITTTDSTACTDVAGHSHFSVSQVGKWDGPYGGFSVDPTKGLVTPIGTSLMRLSRNPASGGAGVMGIVFVGVDSADVTLLDAMFDDGVRTTGVIQWTAPVNQLVTMSYLITLTGGGC
jgi:hypothetical protein